GRAALARTVARASRARRRAPSRAAGGGAAGGGRPAPGRRGGGGGRRGRPGRGGGGGARGARRRPGGGTRRRHTRTARRHAYSCQRVSGPRPAAGGRSAWKESDMSKVSGSNGGDSKNTLYCSFCGKSQHEVRKLIAGPTVFICDECVELCMDIIREENKSSMV